MLPGAPALFTGRDRDVRQLMGALDPRAAGRPVVAVSGLAGVGKTALALAVAHAVRGEGWFPGGALFVDLRGYDPEAPGSAEQAVLSFLRVLGVPDQEVPATSEGQFARYRAELASRDGVLVVLDNAGGGEQVAPLLPGEGDGHRVLVTSRDVLDSLPVRQFGVEALSPEASRELIEESLSAYDPGDRRALDEPDAVRELGVLCGHLPLALLIVAALLRRRRSRSVAALAEELGEAEDRVRALEARGVDQYRRRLSLRPVLEVMYERLEPQLARMFRLLGVVPADFIRVWHAAVVSEAESPDQVEELLDDLTAASLLTRLPGAKLWQMHDLVRLYAQTVVANEEADRAREQLLTEYRIGITQVAEFITGTRRTSETFTGGRGQALAWFDAERAAILNTVQWTRSRNPKVVREAVKLALPLSIPLSYRRAHEEWAEVLTLARDAAVMLGLAEAEALALSYLVIPLGELRRFGEAADAHQQALDAYDRLGDASGRAEAWNNFSHALRESRRYTEAIAGCEEHLRNRLATGDQYGAAIARVNLGMTLRLAGQPAEAYDALSLAVAECARVEDRDGEAHASTVLGTILVDLGRSAEAVGVLTRALGITAETGNWLTRSQGWNCLGAAYTHLGRYEEAIDAFTRPERWHSFHGDEHTRTITQLNLGKTLLKMGAPAQSLTTSAQPLPTSPPTPNTPSTTTSPTPKPPQTAAS